METRVTTHTRSHYHELPSPQSLSNRLVCLWTQRIDDFGGTYCQSILPDGCVDIVWIGAAAPVVAGPATHRIVVRLPPGTSLIGARFRPGWAASSLGLSVDELLNQHVPLTELWGSRAERFTEPVLSHHSVLARLREVVAALTSRFANAPGADRAIQRSIAWLARHPSGRVHDLAHAIGFSDRQLQRRFRAAVGYGPKTFQRIMRLQRLLALSPLMASGQQNLAHLAYSAGYADQAHMCREVRALADKTPQHLLENAGSPLLMSDLFNTNGYHGA
jgi:AraC-like DNA-binding protein